jgi:hypothetical protein
MRRSIVSISIGPELLQRVDDLADAQGVPRSQLIVKLISEGIEDDEMAVRALMNPVVMQAMTTAFRDPMVLRGMAAAVGQELSSEQLQLFHQAMSAASDAVIPAATAAGTPASTPRPKKREKRKRSKR